MVLDREFPPDMRVENEIDCLVKNGHSVHIACYTRKNKPLLEIYKDYTIHRKKISSFIYKSSIGCLQFPFYFNFWKSFVFEIVQKYKIDVIHIHDLPLAKVGNEVKKKYRIPFIVDLHENWPAYLRISSHTQGLFGKTLSNNIQWIDYEKKYTSLADRVIVVVEEAKTRLEKIIENGEKIVIVSNTINLKEISDLEYKPDNNFITLFYGGGINFHRGLQSVIQAMGQIVLQNKNVRFWIVGDGSYKSELEEMSKKLNLTEQIKFFGFKPYKEMLDLLSQSDIALIPHLVSDHTNSTIPHKLFQYMFYEKPIVASECEPIKRILIETNTGLTYNPDNVEELSSLILDIANNPEEYSYLKKNGKLWVNKKYNWKFDQDYLLKLYESLS